VNISTVLWPICCTEFFFLWNAIFHIDLSSFFSLSLSPSVGLWDDRLVLYRALRTIYVGGVEGYWLRTSDTYWKEFCALITHLDTGHFVTRLCIKYFNVLNPHVLCICTRFRNLKDFLILPGKVIFFHATPPINTVNWPTKWPGWPLQQKYETKLYV